MPSVEIVAEIANAHQGDSEQALRLACAALDAGADAVKFQVYFADELLVRTHPRYEHFKQQAFSADIWQEIASQLSRRNASVYYDVFGITALRIAASLPGNTAGFKIHSSDLGNDPLLRQTARAAQDRKLKVLLAVGGSTAREIGHALRLVEVRNQPAAVTLLHGFQSYPTAVEDSNLQRIRWLKLLYGDRAEVGYMDHVSGDDPDAYTLPLIAVGAGAVLVEKHVTLDRQAKGVDYYSSLNPDEFGRFVAAVRKTERAIGSSGEVFAGSEREYRRQVKKHWLVARDLPAGHVLRESDLVMKRVSGVDADCVELEKLVGRELVQSVREDQPLTRWEVKNKVWAALIVRMRSSRLPAKALADVAGRPALEHLFERLKQIRGISGFVLCTTTASEDDVLVELAQQNEVLVHRGPVEDVLGRMLGALQGHDPDVVLRVTGDDILVDPDYADMAIEHHLRTNSEYSDLKALPSGTEVEVFDVDLLRRLWLAAHDSGGTEYLTTYIANHKDQFRTTSVPVQSRHATGWRLTLDCREDYDVIRTFVEAMKVNGKELTYRLDDIVDFFYACPDVLEINAGVHQRKTPPQVCTDLDWRKFTHESRK